MQPSTLNPCGTKLFGIGQDSGPAVIDTATGEMWPVATYVYGEVTPVAWVDDDTYTAVGSKPLTALRARTC